LKKILLASLFLGGGYYFIKKILPNLKSNNKEFEVDTKDYEDEIAENERRRLKDYNREIEAGFRLEDGSFNKNWWLNTNIKTDKEALKNIEDNLNQYYKQN
tara:strand:+ start:1570 stop:1872 length:303 start_codon:yes stop_codon:yes gene_type:complete